MQVEQMTPGRLRRAAISLSLLLATAGATVLLGAGSEPAPTSAAGTVTVALDHPVGSFRPDRALGAGLDGHEHGDTELIYTRRNLRAMASAGFGPVTYRLRTEL